MPISMMPSYPQMKQMGSSQENGQEQGQLISSTNSGKYQSYHNNQDRNESKTLIHTIQMTNGGPVPVILNQDKKVVVPMPGQTVIQPSQNPQQIQQRQDSSQSSSQKMTPIQATTKQQSKLQFGAAIQLNNRNGSVSVANPNHHKNFQMNGHSHSMQPSHASKQVKRVENLPRTGIEYPLMKERRHFISGHKESEPLSDQTVPAYLLDEYIKNDSDRALVPVGQQNVVYDCIEQSQFYEDPINDPFIDERDSIELPPISDQTEEFILKGLVNEPYQKKYFFNPYNPPYQLEKPICILNRYSDNALYAMINSASAAASGNGAGDAKLYDKRGVPRLNRYYEKLKPFYKLNKEDPQNDKTLIFESRFESGNLKRVVKVGEYEYDLYLKNDYGTGGFTQWFYFKVANTRKGHTYRFNLVNFMKPDSTYNKGMKPLIYSVKDAEQTQIGWQRDGFNIAYYQNARKRVGNQVQGMSTHPQPVAQSLVGGGAATQLSSGYYGSYYSLTFEVKFKHDNDIVYFAHCYPFTYSDLCDSIKKVCTYQNKDKIRRTVLCKSLAGNDVEMLIVTNFASTPEAISVRKAVILTCRIHPGESNSSHIMNGVIDYLTSDEEKADFLRNTFVFKIIPMLNPDGVIVGNYRCCLIGQDLNRQWQVPSSKQFPVLYHIKLMMKKTLDSRDIFFFCDFHGHSTKRNVFMYGNNQTKAADKMKERVFPQIYAENNENFSYEDCCFEVQKSREATARVVMWREFNLINSFTKTQYNKYCYISIFSPWRPAFVARQGDSSKEITSTLLYQKQWVACFVKRQPITLRKKTAVRGLEVAWQILIIYLIL